MTFIKKAENIQKENYFKKFSESFQAEIIEWLEILGEIWLNFCYSLKSLIRGNLDRQKFFEQASRFGVDSLPISLLMVSITGMIIAVQVSFEMTKQGAGDYVGMLVAVAIIRELGPVMGGFAVISLVGSSMSAEIATMKVTEQVDAMKVLGVSPVDYLIAPRVFAGFFIMPFVVILASFMGIVGGMFMSSLIAELNMITYINSVWQGLTVKDIVACIVKGFIFGGIISLVSTSMGYRTTGGAIDVGNATTNAVVWAFIIILLANFFVSSFFFS